MANIISGILYETFTGSSRHLRNDRISCKKSKLEMANFSNRFVKAKSKTPLIEVKIVKLKDE